MENIIRVRTDTFEKLMAIEKNRRNWEMLCSSDKPLVPFIGAGISAWCYPMWNDLLKDVVKENFSEECAKIVAAALQSWETKPDIAPEDFHWMEEIAEYIFDDDEDAFNKNRDCIKSLLEKGGNRNVTDGSEKQNANRILAVPITPIIPTCISTWAAMVSIPGGRRCDRCTKLSA